ncbi:MAG: hypothetical protein HZA06_04740 [Nitrospirae bacterium]|nr:hypothetical protein [Nitrospirota bacterium]
MFKRFSVIFLAGVIALSLFPLSCGKKGEAKTSQTMKLHIDYDNESRLQLTVENGYQLWRLNPIDVAHSALTDSHQMADYNACKIEKMDEKHAVVTANYKEITYKVRLARVVKPSGIWTATEIEKLQ